MKKYFCFGESGYKHGTDRSGVGAGCWGAGGGWGLSRVGTRTSETKKYFCYKMVHNGIYMYIYIYISCRSYTFSSYYIKYRDILQ